MYIAYILCSLGRAASDPYHVISCLGENIPEQKMLELHMKQTYESLITTCSNDIRWPNVLCQLLHGAPR
eukprot:scaffold388439_cov15-Prasinocladus_malaysianus.AAC.1